MKPTLSVIIAARNEEDSIALCLETVLATLPPDAEILVVDGGSDATGAIVRAASLRDERVRYIANPDDRGKGHAIRVGIQAGRAPVQVQLDADLQFPPDNLNSLLAPIWEDRADIVLGSRFLRRAQRLPGSTPPLRTAGNVLVSGWASLWSGRLFTDVLAGAKAWTRRAAEGLDLSSDSYSYEVEIPMKAHRQGLRIVEVPVRTVARKNGHSNVPVVRAGMHLIKDIIRFRLG